MLSRVSNTYTYGFDSIDCHKDVLRVCILSDKEIYVLGAAMTEGNFDDINVSRKMIELALS